MLAVACLGAVACLAAVGKGVAPPAPPAPHPQALIREAEQREKEGRAEEAARLFERAAGLEPAGGHSLERAGWSYYDARKLDEARRVFSVVLERDPRSGEAGDGMSVVLFEAGEWAPLWELMRGRVSFEQLEAARALLEAGIAAPPGSVERSWGLAYLLTQPGSRNPRALPHLERVTREQPENGDAACRLARLYEVLGRTEDARRMREDYVRRHPDTPEAFAARAKLQSETSPDEALKEIERGLDRHPTSFLLYSAGAALCERLPDAEAVTERMRGFLGRAQQSGYRPALTTVRLRLAFFCIARGRYAEALPIARELARDAPGSLGWEVAGQLALANGDPKTASEELERSASRVAALAPPSPAVAASLRRWRLLAAIALGRKPEAAAHLAALEGTAGGTLPGYPEAELLRAWLKNDRGFPRYHPGDEREYEIPWNLPPRPQTGLQSAARRAALELAASRLPDCYPIRYSLARDAGRRGDLPAAQEHLRSARDALPSWWAVRWSLGKLYLQRGFATAAHSELLAAQRLAPDLPELKRLLAAAEPR